MICWWCEKETDNKPEETLCGDFVLRLVSFCDECKKAHKDINEIVEEKEKSNIKY